MKSIQELKEERAGIPAQMNAICDKADAEKRPLSNEERETWDKMNADLDLLSEQIQGIEGDLARRAKSQSAIDALKQSSGAKTNLSGGNAAAPVASLSHLAPKDAQLLADFRLGLMSGVGALSGPARAALQVDLASSGGTMVAPEQFQRELIEQVKDLVFIRQLARVIPVMDAESLGVPTLDARPADADWTSEIAIGGEDSTMATGKRALHPHPLGKLIKISKTLLRKSAIPVEALVREQLAFKFGISEEKAFLTGSGAQQPLGVFTASNAGISTGQDVSTGNSTTAVSADGLINAKFALKAQYQASPSLRWIFNRTVVRDIRKLKDGEGQYLWTQGLSDKPDTILGVPYMMSEYAPNTMTQGLYVGIIGDFRHYWIADAMRMEIQRLDELYAGTNQIGLIGRMETDGMPVLEEAFVRVTLA